jgi:hypothetical protein
MSEHHKRIPDIDKAWTAANAENAYREIAKNIYGENPGPELKKLIEESVDKAGENRIANYNPEKEAGLDALKLKAQNLARACRLHLTLEFGSIENAEKQLKPEYLEKMTGANDSEIIFGANRYILDALKLLEVDIRSIDRGAEDLNPKANIEEAEIQIAIALKKIEGLKRNSEIQ